MIAIKDLFNLSDYLISQISYMIDTYEEPDASIAEIPSQTLDDIIDEINRENENTEESSDQNNETTDENTDSNTDPIQDTTDDENTNSDNEEETDEEPKEKSDYEKLIDRINLIITRINGLKSNAFLCHAMDTYCNDISSANIRQLISNLMNCLSDLYTELDTFITIYESTDNINNRSKFIIKSYRALLSFTELVTKIYNALDNSSYLNAINGPVEKDYRHWIDEEVSNYLQSLTVWETLSDNKWLDLIDESIQLDHKYAALLKKLVISEFKGFDEYYESLIQYIEDIKNILNYYETDYVKDSDLGKVFYDPSILAKSSKITMVTYVSIPFDPENSENE